MKIQWNTLNYAFDRIVIGQNAMVELSLSKCHINPCDVITNPSIRFQLNPFPLIDPMIFCRLWLDLASAMEDPQTSTDSKTLSTSSSQSEIFMLLNDAKIN